jgi:two-component system sensor histidine kinase GlrK
VLPLGEAQWRLLSELVEKEGSVFAALRDYPHGSDMSLAAVASFGSLRDLASFILSDRRRVIEREIDETRLIAEQSKRVLTWQLITVAPVVLVLAVVFTLLISRPIRMRDQAIRRLGEGEFTSPINVVGPKDLHYLGEQLDWLRVRLIDLEEQKRKFLDHVSHELKTPLSSIREGAELLSDEVGGTLNEAQRKVVGILRENSIELQRIIENMVNFRAVMLRHTAVYFRDVRLGAIIEKVAAGHGLAMMSKNLTLELRLDDLTVAGDEEKITVVVDNLLSNAVKFSPYGGIIRIRLAADGDHATLDVIDAGPGVPPDERDRVFDPFYQGSVVPDGYVKGTGIGLSVVAEYVRLHGGTIEIVDGPSAGAHFRVRFPGRAG